MTKLGQVAIPPELVARAGLTAEAICDPDRRRIADLIAGLGVGRPLTVIDGGTT